MTPNSNNIENAQRLVGKLNKSNVKYIKKERGLIERENIEADKVVLVEDNREVLLGSDDKRTTII